MRDYTKLEVWKKAHTNYIFVKTKIATILPREERYELTSQLNRAALSIPLNIVEGCGRTTDKDFAHLLDNALGSTNEVEYCCFAALELKYISATDFEIVSTMVNEIRAMLISFIKFLRKK